MLVFIVFVIVILVIFSLLKDRNPYWLDKFNDNLDACLFIIGLIFSIIGLLYMKGIITLGVTDTNYTISGLSIVAFGISLFSMSGSIYQTRKSNKDNDQLKNDINNDFKNILNEITKLTAQNEKILVLLKDKNQKEKRSSNKIAKNLKNKEK